MITSLGARLITQPERRVRAHGLQRTGGAFLACRPGPLTRRVFKQVPTRFSIIPMTLQSRSLLFLAAALVALAPRTEAKINVVATTPDFGSLAQVVGGDHIALTTLTPAHRGSSLRGCQAEFHREAEPGPMSSSRGEPSSSSAGSRRWWRAPATRKSPQAAPGRVACADRAHTSGGAERTGPLEGGYSRPLATRTT